MGVLLSLVLLQVWELKMTDQQTIQSNSLYRADLGLMFLPIHERFFGKSFLITGGLGLIGSVIVDYLIYLNIEKNAGIKMTVADINEDYFKTKFGDCDCVSFLYLDARQQESIPGDYDYIVHCAGIASPELFVSKPVDTLLSHFNGTLSALEYCRKHPNTSMVYISSSEVYGQKDWSDSFTEDRFGVIDGNSLRSSYSLTKKAAELTCHSYASQYGVKVKMVRPGHIFGPGATRKDKRISSQFCFDAADGKDLVLKSDGSQLRSYCYSLDCAAAILFLLLNGVNGETYNVGAKQKTTILQMAEMISELSGVRLIKVQATAQEKAAFNPMSDSSLDSSKLEALGFHYSFDAKTGFDHTIKILKAMK